jgi:SAM-dependent methyltransferase
VALDCAVSDCNSIARSKSCALVDVLKRYIGQPIKDILVVGCGSGQEAAILAKAFLANTIGIDVDDSAFDHDALAAVRLTVMDANELLFPDASFDLVYSFHVLEHIPQPERALREMARVLRPSGTYLIGTPNKRRLVGYIGSPTSLRNKVIWNLQDLLKRVKGQWSNELGAHAGFEERELLRLCKCGFGGQPISITDDYYRALYRSGPVNAIIRSGLKQVVYPCVYVIGAKV